MAGLTDGQLQACDPYGQGTLFGLTSCQWTQYEDAAKEGLLSPALQPSLIRTDFVANSNDTYWLANPRAPMTGYPNIVGTAELQQTPRARSGLMIIERELGSDYSGFFTPDQLLNTMMGNEHYVGQVLRDDIVTMCEATPSIDVDSTPVDLSTACQTLKDWGLTANLDSVGSHIMREFLAIALVGVRDRVMPTKYAYSEPYDVTDPINTPRGLTQDDANKTLVLTDLAKAVLKLQGDSIALDAELGDIQYVTRNGERISIHGGRENEGVFNKMSLGTGSGDYAEVTGSSGSWIMNTALTDDGPIVKALLTYSISTNPDSDNYKNQTERFSQKDFIEIPYNMDDVKAQATSKKTLNQRAYTCRNDGWKLNLSIFADEQECKDHYQEVDKSRLTAFVADE